MWAQLPLLKYQCGIRRFRWQRCLASIKGEAIDCVPVFPLLMVLAPDRLGIKYRQFATDGLSWRTR